MTPENLQEYALFAENLADKSGALLRQYARSAFSVAQKSDRSFVTKLDHQVETLLRAEITEKFPQHGICGEEQGVERADADFLWVLDPIDGTSSFMAGRPTFTTLISLCWRGVPLIGVIDQPLMRDRWSGIHSNAHNLSRTYFNHGLAQTRSCADLSAAMLATTGPNYFSAPGLSAFARIEKSSAQTLYGGDAYNYGLLASGWLDIIVEENLKLHDFCALAPIVAGAGGVISDWRGKNIDINSDGKIIALGDKTLAESVFALI
jgi:inositol-phosphate phosphatase/L-galactose 1-phosphate phosphatase/histidinol-phosphatase